MKRYTIGLITGILLTASAFMFMGATTNQNHTHDATEIEYSSYDYGDYVVLEGTGIYDGVYKVKDTMSPRFTNRVDILRSRGSKHFKYTNVTLYKQDTLTENN